MSTTATAPAALLPREEIDRLAADPAFRTDPERKRQIADHLLDSPPEVLDQLRALWRDDSFDPEESRFVAALFGNISVGNVVPLAAPAAAGQPAPVPEPQEAA